MRRSIGVNLRLSAAIVKRYAQPVTLLLFLVFPAFVQAAEATVRTYKKTFTTYPYSDPNPVPVVGRIYPYYRFDGYTDTPVQKEWTIIELENEFLKVMILPEIGGKIWTAIDKTTGKPFIYYNNVVKFRDIAMRGPWTSGGIEANYGIIGHTPNCATPVDYLVRTNSDGSVSCFIGVLDLLARTPWRLEVNLPADKAYFTTRSFWYNATPLEQPYYTWMNAGIKAKGNLQFIYPGTNYLGHNGEYGAWPRNPDHDKDISYYENNNFGGYKSYHVFGAYTDFFGGYWHDEDFGIARYAARDEKAGKKIWIWGLSEQGMIWEKLLTDADGQYVEIQSGRLFNQSAEQSTFTPFKHRGFAPYASDTWTEYWFPVKQTKGFVAANPYGALNVKQEPDGLKIYLSPVQSIKDTLEVWDSKQRIYAKELQLKPLQTFAVTVNAHIAPARLRVTLGGHKLEYAAASDEAKLNRPLETPQDFDWTSAYGLYLQGKENIRQRNYAAAQQKLEASYAKDKNFPPALNELTTLAYRQMRYDKALEYARRALSIDTYDPAANYLYGLVNLQLNRIADAKDGFDVAAQSLEYRSAAWTELAKIHYRAGAFDHALSYVAKALDFNARNLDAYQIAALVHRARQRPEKATEALAELLAIDPLNHFARFEEFLWHGNPSYKPLPWGSGNTERKFPASSIPLLPDKMFSLYITNEMPQETYLELAIWYYNLGQMVDAEKLLALSPQTAEVLYWRACLQHKLQQSEAAATLKQANAASPHLIFPFRAESAEVLRWAAAQSADWPPNYYLGLLYWSQGDSLAAWEWFKKPDRKPDYAPFYAARSWLAWRLNLHEPALADLQYAMKLDSKQWRYGVSLVSYYSQREAPQPEKALEIAKSYYEQSPANYQLGLLYAKTLLLNRKYQECSDLLAGLKVLPYEGASDGRRLYREANLWLALANLSRNQPGKAREFIAHAREWPKNLGAGKPYQADIDERVEDWLESLSQERSGYTAAARAAWQRIVAFKAKDNGVNDLVTAWAWRKLDQPQRGKKLLSDWKVREPDDMLAQWCEIAFTKNRSAAIEIDNVDYRILRALLTAN